MLARCCNGFADAAPPTRALSTLFSGEHSWFDTCFADCCSHSPYCSASRRWCSRSSTSCPAIRRRRCSARARRRRMSPSCAQLGLDRPLLVAVRPFLVGARARRSRHVVPLRTRRSRRRSRERMPATVELAPRGDGRRGRSSPSRSASWRRSLRGTVVDHARDDAGARSASRCRTSGSGRCSRSVRRRAGMAAGVRHAARSRISCCRRSPSARALAAILARMTRASVLEELRELYVLAARARGRLAHARGAASRISQQPDSGRHDHRAAVRRRADRRVITETIFAWPGIGRLLIQSISFRDYPLVQGCILFIAVTYVGDEPDDRSHVRVARSADPVSNDGPRRRSRSSLVAVLAALARAGG